MAGSKRKRLLPDLNLLPPLQATCLTSESQAPPAPTSQNDTTATSTNGVGDQPIPSVSAVSGLDLNNDPPQSPIPVPRGRSKYKYPPGFILIFGKLYPIRSILQSQMPPPPPTDTAAKSIPLVGDQVIPAASAVNGPQHNDNPPQPPASRPIARKRRPRRKGTAADPDSVGVCENKEIFESNLRFPGVRIPGRSKRGLQIYLGQYRTIQEAQDVHDRAALKLFEAKGVVPVLNFDERRHAKFMEKFKDWDLRDFLWQFRRHSDCFTRGKSSMKGVSVFKRAKGNLFHAKTAYKYSKKERKVPYDLGKFSSEDDAGKAYDRGVLFLRHEETEEQKLNVSTNFRPSTYKDSEILKAGKYFNLRKPILPRLLE